MVLRAIIGSLAAVLLTLSVSVAETADSDWLYTVRPGDTLWDLCKKYSKNPDCWETLDKRNNVSYPPHLPQGMIIRFPAPWLKDAPTPVEVTYVSGNAQVQIKADSELMPLMAGKKLPAGAIVQTGKGQVNLLFPDGSTMQLDNYSELILDSVRTEEGIQAVDSQLRLQRGAVKTRVIKHQPVSQFQITTPTAVAAVRGTQYRVSSESGERNLTRTEVFEGLVEVSAEDITQPVPGEFGIIAKQGEPLQQARPLIKAPTFTLDDSPKMVPLDITWDALNGAANYQFEILNDNEKDEVLTKIETSKTHYKIDLLAQGCYRIRLRGIDSEELQGLATQQQLCIAKRLRLPKLEDKYLEYSDPNTSVLSWKPVGGALHYNIRVASDKKFKNIISETQSVKNSVSLAGIEPLYVQVQAVGEAGQKTEFSATYKWEPEGSHWLTVLIFSCIALVAL